MDYDKTLAELAKHARKQLKATTDQLKAGNAYEASQAALHLSAHTRLLAGLSQHRSHVESLARDAENTKLSDSYRKETKKQLSLASNRLRKAHKEAVEWLEGTA